jgi:exonuclease SbcC
VASSRSCRKAKEEQEYLTVQNTHRELRVGLKKGELCPVCEQKVTVLPKIPVASALESAKNRVKTGGDELRKIQNAIAKAESQVESLPGRLREIDDRIDKAAVVIKRDLQRIYAVSGEMSDADCLNTLNLAVAGIRAAEKEFKAREEISRTADDANRSATGKAARLDTAVTGLSERVEGSNQVLQGLRIQIEAILPDIELAGGAAQIASDLKDINEAKQKKENLALSLKGLTANLQQGQESKSKADQAVAVLNERLRGLDTEIEQLIAAIGNLEKSWAKLEKGFVLPSGEDEADRAEQKRRALEKERLRISGEVVRLDAAVEDIQTRIAQLGDLKKQLEEVSVERSLYEQLASALRADRFMAYLLETVYADLCMKGSEHLMRLSQERYSFTVGKNEFSVKDGWNADAERSASTLSGGESFLASLALALALADSVASFGADGGSGAKLEALFLDEGVSTLDQDETLSAVIDALVGLQKGDRLVGVISHMENLAERLPARIEIVTNKGRSSIRATDAAVMTASPT